jgi:hypothetical protein
MASRSPDIDGAIWQNGFNVTRHCQHVWQFASAYTPWLLRIIAAARSPMMMQGAIMLPERSGQSFA